MTTTTSPVNRRQRDDASSNVLSRDYNQLLRWPTAIDPETSEVRLRLGTTIDALVMRAGFGGEVNHQLVQAMLRGPIIVVPGTKVVDWVFLTQPRTPMRQSTIADLVAARVGWYNVGSTIALPAFGATEGDLYWLQRPETDVELPAWGSVVGAIRRTFRLTW
ncbi:hypothetical protein SAMN05192558_10470 [Actinokineospora alba]|uniref:Uncharacterized protein n=1 Tax=Actinokineospora alba TaxID=504798 RepID=A0A1H0LAQ5_9PSEU|nr:hypothetical protein [Actinokineospora alba]TDP67252.1 hypothetical protein C8E96_2789 [Actinokineospora alba]SDJ02628.1 hypothetical protein SAMN05421871_109227 [Actinokineospora alba]SDO65152.1 hypothetical protein SAMN05192558_10470 [Actinokineospora alba]